jgi:serine O-acetyltransferase
MLLDVEPGSISKTDVSQQLERFFLSPGKWAIAFHRLASRLHGLGIPILPRIISQLSRFFTGIEIHPAAQIGVGVVIEHGIGIVIGETAIVGDYSLIHQGVTLGGTGKETGKRHPTLGKHVTVGAGAIVLGNIQIGDRVCIGAGSIVLQDVPCNCTVFGVPGRILDQTDIQLPIFGATPFPDTGALAIKTLYDRLRTLEYQVEQLREPLGKINSGNSEKAPLNCEEFNTFIEHFLDGAGI